MGDIKVWADFKIFKVKVPIKFSGTSSQAKKRRKGALSEANRSNYIGLILRRI